MSRLLTLAAVIAVSGAAWAQEPAEPQPFPLLNDLPEGWEMGGQPAPLDVLGMKIGMPREAAAAAAIAGLGTTPDQGRLTEEETGIAGEYGISVMYRYAPSFFVMTTSPAGTTDQLYLTFTTGLSGERLGSVSRELKWAEADAPRMPDLIKSVIDKYGEPSYGDLARGSAFWVYHKGQKATLPPDGNWPNKRTRDGSANACVFDGLSYTYSYTPVPPVDPRRDRLLDRKDCSLVVSVVVWESNTPGITRSMKVEMGGLSRVYENFIATDEFLDAELAKKIAGETPPESRAPKL